MERDYRKDLPGKMLRCQSLYFRYGCLRDLMLCISTLFFCAFLAGIISVYFPRNIEDVKIRRISEPNLITPLKNVNFLRLDKCSGIRSGSFYFLHFQPTSLRSILLISIASFALSVVLFILADSHISTALPIIAYILHGFSTSAPAIAFMNAVADMMHRSIPLHSMEQAIGCRIFFSALGSIFGGLMLANLAFLVEMHSLFSFYFLFYSPYSFFHCSDFMMNSDSLQGSHF